MALVSLSGGLWVPDYQYFNQSCLPTFGGQTIDAAAEKTAFIFRAPKAGDLAKVRLRFGTVAIGADTDLKVSFQDVDLSTGYPDGVADQYRIVPTGSIVSDTTVLTGIISSTGADGGTKRTVTKGELLACVVEYDTFNASDSIVVGALATQARVGPTYYSFGALYTAAWAKTTTVWPMMSLEYSDGTYAYMPTVWPSLSASTGTTYNSGSDPNALGLKFRFPFPCKIGGCWLGLDADGNFDVNLYTASGVTTVASGDKDARVSSSGQTAPLIFTAEQTLAANTDYVLAVVPTTATSVGLSVVDVIAAAELDQMNGGQNFHYAAAKDPADTSDFTATTTRRPMMGLLVTAIDDGASAGGGGFPILGGSIVR